MRGFTITVLTWILIGSRTLAQGPLLTTGATGGADAMAPGRALPQGICWFNGESDFRNGFTSERNTSVAESWTFDDFDWPGGAVTEFLGNFVMSDVTIVAAADIAIYRGMGEGNFGLLVAAVNNVTDFTLTPTGRQPREHLLRANLGASSFNLAPGAYHVGIRCVGAGVGQTFVVVTSGEGAIGTPPGNNGRSFLQSNFFGYPLPTDWQNLVGTGIWDVSYGLGCSGGGGYSLSLSGECPGTVSLEWSGADPDRRQGILVASDTGNITLPGGPCQGTQIGLGRQNLRLHRIIGTGEGAGAVSASTQACGWYVQLIQIHSCATSNVAQVP